MKPSLTKQNIMNHYYSDDELRSFRKVSIRQTMKWLEAGRRFFSKITPKATKKLKEQLSLEGW
jgi:hypothetical protein